MTDIEPTPVRFRPETPADLVGRWILLRTGQDTQVIRVEAAEPLFESGMTYTKVVDPLPGLLRIEFKQDTIWGTMCTVVEVVETDTGFAIAPADAVDEWIAKWESFAKVETRGFGNRNYALAAPLVVGIVATLFGLLAFGTADAALPIGAGGAALGLLGAYGLYRDEIKGARAIYDKLTDAIVADRNRFYGADVA